MNGRGSLARIAYVADRVGCSCRRATWDRSVRLRPASCPWLRFGVMPKSSSRTATRIQIRIGAMYDRPCPAEMHCMPTEQILAHKLASGDAADTSSWLCPLMRATANRNTIKVFTATGPQNIARARRGHRAGMDRVAETGRSRTRQGSTRNICVEWSPPQCHRVATATAVTITSDRTDGCRRPCRTIRCRNDRDRRGRIRLTK